MPRPLVRTRWGPQVGRSVAYYLCLSTLAAACASEVTMEAESPESPELSDPGTVTLHRLNRTEYNNTVRDLLGTSSTPADEFPADDTGYGFDNVADVLSLSPLHLELYERAAQSLIDEALRNPVLEPLRQRFDAGEATIDEAYGGPLGEGAAMLWSNGEATLGIDFELAGTYRFEARAYGQQAGPEVVRMAFVVDAVSIGEVEVAATEGGSEVYGAEAAVRAGRHEVGVAFLNDFYDPANNQDRNLVIEWIAVDGPLDAVGEPNPRRAEIITCDLANAGCLEGIVRDFTARAWRRPVTDAEVAELVALAAAVEAESGNRDDGLALALQAVLVSPHFIFRVEGDPSLADPTPHLVDDYAMASRLSYFLWSTMPDQTLFDLAAAGRLQDPVVLEEQVVRMLADPRAEALVSGFAHQWLYIRDIANAFPDTWVFPGFDEDLRAAMIAEMEHFVRSFLTTDRDLRELLTADEVWVNERLAEHYGLEGVSGAELRAVPANGNRGGILTQAGLLTVLSTPARTSIVRRGKWVLTQLLCDEPSNPPPGVEGLVEQGEAASGSLRERMLAHQTLPICVSCHAVMDPIGFALENYDGIGGWRDDDNGYAIDATGELPDGRRFEGARELSAVLANDPGFAACATEKLFTYALGRGPELTDDAYLEAITARFVASGYRFSSLATAIATSAPFRYRRAEVSQ